MDETPKPKRRNKKPRARIVKAEIVANPVGAPTKFTDAISEKIVELAREGLTIEQIADKIGVSDRTIYFWQKKNDKLFQSIKDAKMIPDQMVIAALFSIAVGYTKVIPRSTVAFGQVIDYEETMHIPPDIRAIQFWLSNRQGADWRNKQPDALPPPDPSKPDLTDANLVFKWPDESND